MTMADVIAWVSYVGAWLLVAGPLWQAAIELHEENLSRERFEEIGKRLPQEHVPIWWWLVPPVAYYLRRRASARYRDAVIARLSPEEIEALMSYVAKADGWLLVGLGGTCIGLKETWELREHFEWPLYTFYLLTLLALVLCVVNLLLRLARSRGVMAAAGHEQPSRRRA